ncbi:hypothetical protein E4A41_13830, partial [Micrococcus endophyticus]
LTAERAEELRRHVGTVIGPVAKPAEVVFVPDVPKTRSGKIMRRYSRSCTPAPPWATPRACRTRCAWGRSRRCWRTARAADPGPAFARETEVRRAVDWTALPR